MMDEEKNTDNFDNLDNSADFDENSDTIFNSMFSSDEEQTLEKKEEMPLENDTLKNEADDIVQDKLVTVRPVKFQEFKEETINRSIKKNLDIIQDVSMHITVEIGRTRSSVKEIMDLEKGSVVELDKIAGEQVEVYANNKLVARGEVIVIEDRFGVRVTTTNIPKQEEEN